MPSARPALLCLVALLAALPSLAALALFGVFEPPDAPGYEAYAALILHHAIPSGEALLHGGQGWITLFRMGGFPQLLAWLQALFPAQWRLALAAGQIAAQSAVAAGSFTVARRLGASTPLALAAALLPACGYVVVLNLCVLTDALNAAFLTGAALVLLLRPDWAGALLAGALLAAAEGLREASIFIALAYIPLALCARPRLLCVALLVLPAWAVAGAHISWNMARGAGPVLTTSKQLVMVQALLPLFKWHLPVYAGDPVFQEAARGTVDTGEISGVDPFWARLYAQGLTAPQIAAEAGHDYATAWRRLPGPMLAMALQNFRYDDLFMPFEPQKALAMLRFYEDGRRPDFDRLNLQWRAFRHGDARAGAIWLGSWLLGLAGMAISLAGLIGPWSYPGTTPGLWRERALWCVPVGLAALYLPVHLEPRYLVPAVPLITILAASAITRWRA
jgi:hypothetical protein